MSLCLVLPRVLQRTLIASGGRPFMPPILAPPPRAIALLPRWSSTAVPAPAATPEPSTSAENPVDAPPPQPQPQPTYQLTFTCRPCRTRSTHSISQQAYHRGSVLVRCPGCRNRHVITDHLKVSSGGRGRLGIRRREMAHDARIDLWREGEDAGRYPARGGEG